MDCTPVLQLARVAFRHVAHGTSPRGLVRHFHHAARIAARPAASVCRQGALLAKPLAMAAAIALGIGPAVPALPQPGRDMPTEIVQPAVSSLGANDSAAPGAVSPLPATGLNLPFGLAEDDLAPWRGPVSAPTQLAFNSLQPFSDLSDAAPERLPEPGTIILFAAGLAGLALARRGHAGIAPKALAHRAIARKSSATRLAPPTSAPPTSGTASSDAALAGLTDPP